MSPRLEINPRLSLRHDENQEQQQLLQTLHEHEISSWKHWRDRLTKDRIFCMLPRNRGLVTPQQARKNDQETGNWIDEYCKWEVEASERKRKYLMQERPDVLSLEAHQALHIGVGKGLGMSYLSEVLEAGMYPVIVDWQRAGLKTAKRKLDRMLCNSPLLTDEVLKLAEAKRFLQALNPLLVKFIQMSRVAAEAYQGAGRILGSEDARLVIIGAIDCPGNEAIQTETSHHHKTDWIHSWVEQGAGRPVAMYRSSTFVDIADVVLTAMTWQAIPSDARVAE
jgi:hypothetical protein